MKKWKPRRTKYELRNGLVQPILLERHVLREIVDRLWYQAKIKVWQIRERIPGKGELSTPGIPDLMGWIQAPFSSMSGSGVRPTPLYIEVKRPGGARRPAQERFIEEAKAGGCAAFFAESWMDVVRELSMFGIPLKIDQGAIK